MNKIIELLLTGLFFFAYTFVLKFLSQSLPISPLTNFTLIFVLLFIVLPLSFGSALQMIKIIKRS
ncbi:hypothetical protein [Fusibacter bizertensis]